jgi:hypothetical protein
MSRRSLYLIFAAALTCFVTLTTPAQAQTGGYDPTGSGAVTPPMQEESESDQAAPIIVFAVPGRTPWWVANLRVAARTTLAERAGSVHGVRSAEARRPTVAVRPGPRR